MRPTKLWTPSAPAIITRRRLLTGAAALGAYAALGSEPALATGWSLTASVGAILATTSAVNTTGANLIIVSISCYDGTTPSGLLFDNKSNTYTQIYADDQYSVSQGLYYCLNPTVGTGHTFNPDGANYYAIMAMAFSGAATSSALDKNNHAKQATGATLQPGSITSSQNNSLIVSALGTDGQDTYPATYAIDSSFTIPSGCSQSPVNGSPNRSGACAYFVQATAAGINPTWSGWSTGGSYPSSIAQIASFKPAAAPPPASGFVMPMSTP